MRRLAPFLPLLLVVAASCSLVRSRPGGWFVEDQIRSSLLDDTWERYVVILPPGYDERKEPAYPVLYWLHDAFGNESSLVTRRIADRLRERMQEGKLAPMVIVCPAGRGWWYTNSFDRSMLFADFLATELPREIEAKYRVRKDRRGRAISGISMGGFGAIHQALVHPELWGSASSISGALQEMHGTRIEDFPWIIRGQTRRIFGTGPQANNLAENDTVTVFESDPTLPKRLPPILLLAGTEDQHRLDDAAARLGERMKARNADVILELSPGRHDWDYWESAMLRAAQFHSRHFAPSETTSEP